MKSLKPENPHVDNADSWQAETKRLHGIGEPRHKSEIEMMLDDYTPLSNEEAQILNDLAKMEEEREEFEKEVVQLFTLGHKIKALEKLKELADKNKKQYEELLTEYAKIA